jgi:hypothetical protein
MAVLDEKQMSTHVTLLGWIMIALHAVTLLIAGFVFILLVGIGVVAADAEATRILAVVGTFVAGILTLLALPGLLAGAGLLAHKRWGRILALVVALLGILNFPIGTLVSIYAFWVLLQDASATYFE